MSEDLQSKEGRESFYRELFWKTFRTRTKGLIGGAVTGLLLGASVGAAAGLAVAALNLATVGAAVAVGAACMGAYGMHTGMTVFSGVGETAGAITYGLAQKERLDLEKEGVIAPQEEVHSSRPYSFKMGAIGAAVGAAIGGVIATAGALAVGTAGLPITLGFFGITATGAAAAAICVGTMTLLGSTFGINLSYFKNIMNASEKVVEGDLSTSVRELRGHGKAVDAPAQGLTEPRSAILREEAPENVVRADFRQKVLEQSVQVPSQGRGV